MNSNTLRRDISTVEAMEDLVRWRQRLFPHLKKKNLIAVLVILNNLFSKLRCLWWNSVSSTYKVSLENLQEEMWGNHNLHVRITRKEPTTNARNLVTTLLTVLAGWRNQGRRNTRMKVLMTRRKRRNLQSPNRTRRLVSERLGHSLARKWILKKNLRNVMKRKVLKWSQSLVWQVLQIGRASCRERV